MLLPKRKHEYTVDKASISHLSEEVHMKLMKRNLTRTPNIQETGVEE